MSYIVRNTIILASALLLLLGPGIYFTFFSLPKQIKVIDKGIKALEDSLQNTPDLANKYNDKLAQLEEIKRQWAARTKEIPEKDITGETYDYLNRILLKVGDFKMNVNYAGQKNFKRFGYNEYTIEGNALFTQVYRFLWHIENDRRLMKISRISLTSTVEVDSTGTKVYLRYVMTMQAYYSSIKELNTAPASQENSPQDLVTNPFMPVIADNDPPIRSGQVNIERSDLQMVFPGKAYIVDQNKKIRTLEEGDPVWLGRVTRILPEEGKIECSLSHCGASDIITLSIHSGQENTQ